MGFFKALVVALFGLACGITCMVCLFFFFKVEGYWLLGCSFFYGLAMVWFLNQFRAEVRRQSGK